MSKYGDHCPACDKCDKQFLGNCTSYREREAFSKWFINAWEEVKKSAEAIRK